MVKLVLEISEKEKKVLEKSGREVKNLFKRVAGAFKIRVIKEKKKSKK